MGPTRARRRAAWIGRTARVWLLVTFAAAGCLILPVAAGASRRHPSARAGPLHLTAVMARRAIRTVLAGSDGRTTKVEGCRRGSSVSITCNAVQEVFTPPSETSPAVYELLEGRFTVTLKHDHGREYMRVHQD